MVTPPSDKQCGIHYLSLMHSHTFAHTLPIKWEEMLLVCVFLNKPTNVAQNKRFSLTLFECVCGRVCVALCVCVFVCSSCSPATVSLIKKVVCAPFVLHTSGFLCGQMQAECFDTDCPILVLHKPTQALPLLRILQCVVWPFTVTHEHRFEKGL